jgi:hypothetical protein
VENTEIVNNVFETGSPASSTDQPVAQEDSSSALDLNPDDDSTSDASSSDPFASDDGGDFLGGDDS